MRRRGGGLGSIHIAGVAPRRFQRLHIGNGFVGGLSAGDRVITSDYSAFEKVDQVNLTN